MNNIKKYQLEGIEADALKAIEAEEYLSSEFLYSLYEIENPKEMARVRALILLTAQEKGIATELKKVLKKYDEEAEKLYSERMNAMANETEFTFEHTTLMCGSWTADDAGVRRATKNGDIAYASKIPVVPVALLENISTGTEKVQLRFKKGTVIKDLISERKVTASNSSIVNLANEGLEVTSENAKQLVAYISDCITGNIEKLPRYNAFSQLGWNIYGFMPYTSEAIFDGESENRTLYQSIKEKGDFERWKVFTQEARKKPLVRLAMAASFASVLIRKIGGLPFVFHLWGKSGTGKTVVLKICMSIWGDPSMGKLTRTMNMTANSMMSTAAFLNDLPFAGDELQTIKSRWDNYDQLIMRITEGIDRGRMEFNKIVETKTWNCAFIFTGEDPCTQAASGGGVKNRVIEAEVSEPLFVGIAGNEANTFVQNNYGHAGRVFIEYIQGIKDLNERYKEKCSLILDGTDTTEKQASSMALMMLADELARECFYVEEEALNIKTIAPFLFSDKEIDVGERAYEFIVDHIAQNANRFSFDNYGECWGCFEEEKDRVLIIKKVLERELASVGFDFNAIKRKWVSLGYLQPTSDGRYTHHLKPRGYQKAHYAIINLPKTDPIEDKTDYNDEDF